MVHIGEGYDLTGRSYTVYLLDNRYVSEEDFIEDTVQQVRLQNSLQDVGVLLIHQF